MKWLEDKIYSSVETQKNWSIEQWRSLWAQILKIVEEGFSNISPEIVTKTQNSRQRAIFEQTLIKKQLAELEIASWDISRMSYHVQLIIKAQLMQRVKYKYALHKFKNLLPLEDINSPKEVFDLRITPGTEKSLKGYYNMNIYV